MVGIPWVQCRWWIPISKLRRDGLPHCQGPMFFYPGNARRIVGRHIIRVDLGAGGGRYSRSTKYIFKPHGDAEQRRRGTGGIEICLFLQRISPNCIGINILPGLQKLKLVDSME